MTEPLCITLLVDNRPGGEGLATEHGLSLWIEAGCHCLLFDTGQGDALAANARHLGVDLQAASAVVLSHGHYDHTGGLPHALGLARRAFIHAHHEVLLTRYSVRPGNARSIGIPADAGRALHSVPVSRLRWVEHPASPAPGWGIACPVPRVTPFEDTGGPFFLDEAGTRPDPINDDLSLWFDTPKGLVICTGCCHAGLVNTVLHVQSLVPGRRIRAILGGLHLLAAGEERMARTIAFLSDLAPDMIVPCHCTGDAAMERLAAELGDTVRPGAVGQEWVFD